MFHFPFSVEITLRVWYLYCIVSDRAVVPTVIDLPALISIDSTLIPCTLHTLSPSLCAHADKQTPPMFTHV